MKSAIIFSIIALPAILADVHNLLDLVVVARPISKDLWIEGKNETDGEVVRMGPAMYPLWPKCIDERNPHHWTFDCIDRRRFQQVADFRFSQVTKDPRPFVLCMDGTNKLNVSYTLCSSPKARLTLQCNITVREGGNFVMEVSEGPVGIEWGDALDVQCV
jgi:hypothetical protein